MMVVYLHACVCLCLPARACRHRNNCRYVCCLCLRALKCRGVVDPVLQWRGAGCATLLFRRSMVKWRCWLILDSRQTGGPISDWTTKASAFNCHLSHMALDSDRPSCGQTTHEPVPFNLLGLIPGWGLSIPNPGKVSQASDQDSSWHLLGRSSGHVQARVGPRADTVSAQFTQLTWECIDVTP